MFCVDEWEEKMYYAAVFSTIIDNLQSNYGGFRKSHLAGYPTGDANCRIERLHFPLYAGFVAENGIHWTQGGLHEKSQHARFL